MGIDISSSRRKPSSFRRAGLLALAVASTLPACAMTPDSARQKVLEAELAERGWRAGEEVRSVNGYNVQGFQPIDDRHVILDAGITRQYLITTASPCRDLQYNERLRVSTNVANELTTLDTVYALDPTGRQACPIARLQRLERISSAQ
ncbi:MULTISPECIES: DUF6491 family protein [Hydrocarboniphaga]|jgi:hypothetical protein|uniref:Lipoprotein n=1 Tax=Hydrocarboniphaga effusa AP103 TaxID=1172194 RepID=I8T1X8_9GAMM|nr:MULTISPECIES: DUF6491 family protein [Hydrocarboniphaga]EIT67920.1 hypothetical protein WQQ_43550 [Hydrocarboniphaga effusa AP103]MDZ4077017.1 DUF6491 family protein [Hydrocarboniphaga sp.]